MLSTPRSRMNVAAQACENCRRRKSRCDELRPKCTQCQRLKVECVYKEQTRTSPSASEDSVSKMMDSLERLEEKVDSMSLAQSGSSTSTRTTPGRSSSQATPGTPGSAAVDSMPAPTDFRESPPYFTAPHRTLVWPNIFTRLTRSVPAAADGLAALSEGGTSWLLSHEMDRFGTRLPAEIGVPATTWDHQSFPSMIHFASLTPDRVSSYSHAYFNTFNVVYPILDEELFTKDVLPIPFTSGFRYGHPASVLTLFVLALGQLAIESLTGSPIELPDGRLSGLRGGTVSHPPGLELFNEGRTRLGTLILRGDVSSVQVLLLEATYFQANGCHVEYWRAITQANMQCQLLAHSPSVQWQTVNGDLLRRAFWTCVIDENFYHQDLDLPRTNICLLMDMIRLPNFSKALGSSKWTSGDRIQTLSEFYFLAKISLQRVITRIHSAVQGYAKRFENLHDYSSPPSQVIRELDRQLDAWRAQLPLALQWSDEDPQTVSLDDPRMERPVEGTSDPMLQDDNSSKINRAGAEILAVELRARFYSARFSLLRPFLFKAIHFAEVMDDRDAESCVAAIEAACMLPAALAPARAKKRLLPHPFTWTQNLIAALALLWISQRNTYLSRLFQARLDQEHVGEVVKQMSQWIQDVRQMDSIAEWGWRFLEPMFPDDGPHFSP